MPNLMFEHLAILEILTVNAQKMGSRDPDPTPLYANFSLGSCRDFDWEHACTI